jgi:ribonuclease III
MPPHIRCARSAGSPSCRIESAPTVVTTPDARPSKPNNSDGVTAESIEPREADLASLDHPSKRVREGEGLEALGVPPEGGPLYELALVHRSFAFEQPEPVAHNERLEFLGDAILGAVVTDLIYTNYPALSEGEMARLRASVVNTHALADIARSLGLGQHIRLGKGEEASGGREKPSLLANTLEAVIGAHYLDRGLDATRDMLAPLFATRVQARLEAGGRYDAKTALQEVVVREKGTFPAYRVAASGPDHDKRFTAHVYVDANLYGIGDGRSKKEAEQNAAREALARFETGRIETPQRAGDQGRPDARAS